MMRTVRTQLQSKWRFTGRLLLALCIVLPVAAPGGPRALPAAQPSVIAVADVHGDLAAFQAILQKAGVVDARNRWVAQGITVVQTGDVVDRGAHSRQVLDLLMELEKQAPKKKSRLIALLGNHEVMNITGDLRYVTPPEFAAFADGKSEKRRVAEWKQLEAWKKERARALGKPEPAPNAQPEAAWLEAHPLGYFEQREAYGPRGKYGRWLRQHDTVALVEGTLFVHGGISPELPAAKLEDINARVRDELALFDQYTAYLAQQRIILPFFDLVEMTTAVQEELQARTAALAAKSARAAAEGKSYQPSAEEKQQVDILSQFLEYPSWFSINHEGPLWYRGYARWTEEEGPALAEKVLSKFGAKAIVVGHTPLKSGRMLARFGGKVFLIDTGMLSSYYEGGRASALEIVGEKFTAVYMDQSTVLHPAGAVPAGNQQEEEAQREEPGGGLAPPRVAQGSARASAGAKPAAPAYAWKGPGGAVLPFRDEAEVLEFLRTAEVVSIREIGSGVTKPQKVLLEKNGVRMNAIFRAHNSEKPEAQMRDGRRVRNFRDSYKLEVAAYQLAKLLALEAIPPVADRRIAGRDGSVQVWIEDAMTETMRLEKKITPPDQHRWNQQVQMMRLFDLLVYNWDRHTDNIIIDPQWNLWMVDHTRTFRRDTDVPYVGQIILCERKFWQRLQDVDDEAIRQRLKGILHDSELNSLLKRRQKLVEHLRERIASRGEADVLFSWPVGG
jgi:hypothetical protein